MARELRYGTATIVPVGQAFDNTDGVTLETALTLTNEKITFIMQDNDGTGSTVVLDNVTGATSGTDNDINYVTGSDNAMLEIELTAANTSYYGNGEISITDAANHCPIFCQVRIISQAEWDRKYGTAVQGVNVTQISGDGTAADNLEAYCDGTTKQPVDLVSILGTALTETAGLIAAGFKKFFNVATPTGTVNSLPDAAPDAPGGLPISGAGGLDLDAIPTAFTAIKGATFDTATDSLEALRDRGDAAWITGSGGTPLTAQETRDALKLAPTAGAPAAGSVDEHLDNFFTAAEVEQIRYKIDIDGTQTAPSAGGSAGKLPSLQDLNDRVAQVLAFHQIARSSEISSVGVVWGAGGEPPDWTARTPDYVIRILGLGATYWDGGQWNPESDPNTTVVGTLDADGWHFGGVDHGYDKIFCVDTSALGQGYPVTLTVNHDAGGMAEDPLVITCPHNGWFTLAPDGHVLQWFSNFNALQTNHHATESADGALEAALALTAKTGADGDTLETLSDQIDEVTALDAAGVRAALGMAAADLDTQLDTILAAGGGTAPLTESETKDAVMTALLAYDTAHGGGAVQGGTVTAGTLVGESFAAGPRTATTVKSLFDKVRSALNDENANLYKDPKMVNFYNRAVQEIWSLLIAFGAEVITNAGTIVSDGGGTDFQLPTDFRAFVPESLMPRSPITAIADYTHGYPLGHVGIYDSVMKGAPTATATPRFFAIFKSGSSQYIRFATKPASGERFDFLYYPEVQPVTVSSVIAGTATTPWLGLCDPLISRVLEEFCREGLEFVTTKREQWRARASADLVQLITLRHVFEHRHNPSALRGLPR